MDESKNHVCIDHLFSNLYGDLDAGTELGDADQFNDEDICSVSGFAIWLSGYSSGASVHQSGRNYDEA